MMENVINKLKNWNKANNKANTNDKENSEKEELDFIETVVVKSNDGLIERIDKTIVDKKGRKLLLD